MDCGIGYFLGKGFLVPPLLKSWKSGKKWVLITYYYTQSGMDNGLKSAGVQCWGGLQWSEGNNSAVQRELCGKNHEISPPPSEQSRGRTVQTIRTFPLKYWKGGGRLFSWFLPQNSPWIAELNPSLVIVLPPEHCTGATPWH